MAWGFDVSVAVCRLWLAKYRLGQGVKDGSHGVFELSRQDLRRWYYIDGLRDSALQRKYRTSCGIHADRVILTRWVQASAQVLDSFDNNEDVYAHAAGEYVLEQLQEGVAAADVVQMLRERYLVDTTVQRVNAYRYYREQKGDYWTAERLERDHWEFLYGLVSLQKNLARMSDQRTFGMVYHNVVEARVVLAEHLGRAEELIPLQNLGVFFSRHQSHARLVGLYPEARVYKDAVPVGVVNAFRETFRGQVLPACGFGVIRRGGIESRNRILKVAGDSDLIVFPKASAEACLLAAYAMSKCAEIYQQLTWYGSAPTLVQRDVALKHPCVDFFFWVMYGSWSFCDDCGSYWFNDQYFRERVYQDQATADTPDLCAAYRRLIPSDPMEHEYGKLGISSRWWYLPGMYKPVTYCERCTRPCPGMSSGARFASALRERRRDVAAPVQRTSQLYRIPRIRSIGSTFRPWSRECITWPRYRYGMYSLQNTAGESMLDLSTAEARALQIVVLRTSVQEEKFSEYGPAHHKNWKKVGLSRAYFKPDRVQEAGMPTPKARAAFRFLMDHNRYYKAFQEMHARLIASQASLNVRVMGMSPRGYFWV